MVRAAYSSGKPAYGVGAGNATMVIDETADIDEAARNTAISKTNDHGSGCSADGNVLVDSRIYDQFVAQLVAEGGYIVNADEKARLQAAYWDADGHRTSDTVARSAQVVAKKAGIAIPDDRRFFIVPEDHIGREHLFSTEKLGVVLAVFKYTGWHTALDMVRRIFETGGKGHSCGIYSHDDSHIDRLARMAPVSRMMVRQIAPTRFARTADDVEHGVRTWGGSITKEPLAST
jgi:sulfoacetaldehyde dehydrogenase